MALRKSSSSSTSKTTTTPRQDISGGQGFFVGGTSSNSAPSSSSPKTSSTPKSSGSSKTVSYYDVDGNPDTKSDGSGLKFASTPPGLKINSKGQATDSAGNVSQDRMGMLPGTPGSSQGLVTPTGPVTTSDPATNAVGNLGNQITQGLNTPPVSPTPGNPMGQYNPAFDPSKDLAVQKEIQEGNKIYADRQKELKKERDAAIADLKVSAQIDKQQLAENQRKETGVTNRNLAYLQQGGQSASAMAYMNDLEISHGREQANLTAKYNSAILAARVAYGEKDFQLADAMVKNAQVIKKDAYQRNQDFLDNAIKINNFVMQQKKFEFDMQQAEYERQTQAKQFAIDNGIEQQFYDVGGIVYRTSDGQAFSTAQEFVAAGGDPKFGNVFVVKPGSKEAKAYVYDLATKYVDAGIDPTSDDPATAMAKVKNSAIYREQVRPPSSSGGGGGQENKLKSDIQADIQGITNKWQESGWLNSGYIGSDRYKQEKGNFVKNYAGDVADPGKMFDNHFFYLVNSTGDKWQSDYGIN